MVLEYGTGTVQPDWQVTEKKAPGYSRMYYMYGGEVTYADVDGSRQLHSGFLYLFPSTRPYQMRHNPKNPISCLFTHLDLLPVSVDRLLELDVREDGFLLRFLEALDFAAKARDDALVSSMMDTFELYCVKKRWLRRPPEAIASVLLFIAGHLRDELHIGALSRMAGYQPEYFIRMFKKYTGVTPYQSIISLRLKEAAEQLKKGRSVTEAAEYAGYADIKTFGRAFKEKFGVPPGAWKKHYTPLP